MKELLVAWILSIMASLSPPHKPRVVMVPEARESYAQADARYREAAEDIIAGTFKAPRSIFYGPKGRAKTALLVATIFFMESGYRRDVDMGLGRARLARSGLNDFGRSWCMGQINLGRKPMKDPETGEWLEESASTTEEGWTGKDLVQDRQKCVIATIAVLRRSLSSCKELPINSRLALYASGSCEKQSGIAASEARMSLFSRILSRNKFPDVSDSDVMAEIAGENESVASQ